MRRVDCHCNGGIPFYGICKTEREGDGEGGGTVGMIGR